MKPILQFHLCITAVLGFALLTPGPRAAHAQAAATSPAATLGSETHITSKLGRFDFNTRSLVYSENVRVVDPRIQLTCEYLTAKFPTNGARRVESITAETNVVALISTNDITYTITAAMAVYTYRPEATKTNETLELTGSPEPAIRWVSGDQPAAKTNEFTARRIVWDLTNNQISAEDNRGSFPDFSNAQHRIKPDTGATNAVSTNTVPEPKPSTP